MLKLAYTVVYFKFITLKLYLSTIFFNTCNIKIYLQNIVLLIIRLLILCYVMIHTDSFKKLKLDF